MLRTVLHTRGWWKFSLADIKKIFCRRDTWSKSSHVLVVAAWNIFPIHSLMSGTNFVAPRCCCVVRFFSWLISMLLILILILTNLSSSHAMELFFGQIWISTIPIQFECCSWKPYNCWKDLVGNPTLYSLVSWDCRKVSTLITATVWTRVALISKIIKFDGRC